MYPALAEDQARLTELLQSVHDLAARELATLDERPTWKPRSTRAAEQLPGDGLGTPGALEHFVERWASGFPGSAGPRYLGFVTGGATPAAIAADWLTSVYDQNAGGAVGSSASELEHETLAWLREMFALGDAQHGAFVTGSAMSNTAALAIAREWLGEQSGITVSAQGLAALGPVTVLSGSPHSSIGKAASIVGFGRSAVQRVALEPGNREAVDVHALADALHRLGGRACIVVANAGTVDTVDFDDLRAIAALKQHYNFWLHVDAAFGAFAALLPERAHLTDGLGAADSVCVDLHKWLNVPYDSAVVFTQRQDLQVRVFHNASPYLGLPELPDPDFLHLTPENSRRLRALPAWLSLAAYGRAGYREIVTRNSDLAHRFGAAIEELEDLQMLAPVRLNVVCFTLASDPTHERVRAAIADAAATGEAFVTPTVYRGVPAMRAAFSNWRTEETDLQRILAAITHSSTPRAGRTSSP